MSEIKGITLKDLQQNESFEFHSSVYNVFASVQSGVSAAVVDGYGDTVDGFDAALKQIRESAVTDALTAADARRDNAWRGLHNAVTLALKHFNAATVQAAHVLDIIIRNYGNPTDKSYPNETSMIFNLCQELGTEANTALLQTVGAADRFEELEAANDNFRALFEQRGNEQSILVAGLAKDARKAAEDAYRLLVKTVNAMLVLNPTAVLERCVERVNYFVDYYGNLIARRKGIAEAEKKKKEAEAAKAKENNPDNEEEIKN